MQNIIKLCGLTFLFFFKYNMDNYVDEIIKIKVPKWQIGEEVSIYFKDSMYIKGICEKEENKNKYKIKRMNITGDIYE